MRGIVDDGQDQANGPTGAEPRTAAAFPSDPAALESTALRRCSRQIVPRHAAAGPAAAGKVQVPWASVAVERRAAVDGFSAMGQNWAEGIQEGPVGALALG